MDRGHRLTALLLCGLALVTARAEAYVLVPDENTGAPLRWVGTRGITVLANAGGSQQLEGGGEFLALEAAAENWNRAMATCTQLRLEVAAPASGLGVENDGRVAVVWIEDGWPYSPEWSATTAVQLGAAGQIVDADIQINEEWHTFTTEGEEKKVDLESTLTHELGHVLGLDHTCYLGQGAPDPLPLDHLGQPIGPCSEGDVVQSTLPTMFPGVSTSSTALRTPEADDVAGVCALYPADEDPEDPGGCSLGTAPRASAAPGPGGMGALSLFLLFLFFSSVTRGGRRVSSSSAG